MQPICLLIALSAARSGERASYPLLVSTGSSLLSVLLLPPDWQAWQNIVLSEMKRVDNRRRVSSSSGGSKPGVPCSSEIRNHRGAFR